MDDGPPCYTHGDAFGRIAEGGKDAVLRGRVRFYALLAEELMAAARERAAGALARVRRLLRRQPDHIRAGRAGEKLVARLAASRGLRVLRRNYRCRMGEIDLIAADRGVIVFIEVKTRSMLDDGGVGAPIVRARQQRRILRAAICYVRSRGLDPDQVPMRFDLAVIRRDGRRYEIEQYEEGAFDAGSARS